MSERPTPAEIIALLDFHGILTPHMRKSLEGCVIVHPDDAPEEWEYTDDQLMYQSHAERAFFSDGYRVCRSLIFEGQP